MNLIQHILSGQFFGFDSYLVRFCPDQGKLIVYLGNQVYHRIPVISHDDDLCDPLVYWIESNAHLITTDVVVPEFLSMRVTTMKWANAMVRKGLRFKVAIQKAIAAYKLRKKMDSSVEEVIYYNPTARKFVVVHGTRRIDVVRNSQSLYPYAGPFAPVIRYFDTSVSDFRSIKIQHLIPY